MRSMSKVCTGLFLMAMLAGCESVEKPNVPLAPPVKPRATAQSIDFAGFVINAIKTQTLDSSQPASVDSVLLNDTQDPRAFDELFAVAE